LTVGTGMTVAGAGPMYTDTLAKAYVSASTTGNYFVKANAMGWSGSATDLTFTIHSISSQANGSVSLYLQLEDIPAEDDFVQITSVGTGGFTAAMGTTRYKTVDFNIPTGKYIADVAIDVTTAFDQTGYVAITNSNLTVGPMGPTMVGAAAKKTITANTTNDMAYYHANGLGLLKSSATASILLMFTSGEPTVGDVSVYVRYADIPDAELFEENSIDFDTSNLTTAGMQKYEQRNISVPTGKYISGVYYDVVTAFDVSASLMIGIDPLNTAMAPGFTKLVSALQLTMGVSSNDYYVNTERSGPFTISPAIMSAPWQSSSDVKIQLTIAAGTPTTGLVKVYVIYSDLPNFPQ
jgi:hypothetical protein